MTFINRAEVNPTPPQVAAVDAGTPVTAAWGILTCIAYDPATNAMAVIGSAPNPTDPTAGGMRFTDDGRLYVWPVSTLGVPSVVAWRAGLPFVPDGRMVVSSNPVSNYVAGWPMTVDGWVCMTLSGPPPILPGPFTFTVGEDGGG